MAGVPVPAAAAAPLQFCIPSTGLCRTMAEWGIFWQALGVIAALVFGLFGLYKIFFELRRLNEQREKDRHDKETSATLKRTEFFLNQHRRLFDDPTLNSVLELLDDDNVVLAKREMWDAKRKFLTFIEEIALLVRTDQIKKDVALYMFGYYARCALGHNFMTGINATPEHWRLFYWFAREAEKFSEQHPGGYLVQAL